MNVREPMKQMNEAELKKKIGITFKKHYPINLSELCRLMNYSNKKRIKRLFPELPALLEKNKAIHELN